MKVVVVGNDDHAATSLAAEVDILHRRIGKFLSLRRRRCIVLVRLILGAVVIDSVDASVLIIVDDREMMVWGQWNRCSQ